MSVPGESLPRRSSRSHLPSAKSVDCLSFAHNQFSEAAAAQTQMRPMLVTSELPNFASPSSLARRDESPAMQRVSSFSQRSQSHSASFTHVASLSMAVAPAAPPPPPMLATTKMHAAFECRVETNWGDTAVLVGSTPQMGSWNPERGVRLATDSGMYPMWSAHLALDCDDTSFEYKMIVVRSDGSVDWEPLPDNRRLNLFPGRNVRVRATWDDPLEEESHVKLDPSLQMQSHGGGGVPPLPTPHIQPTPTTVDGLRVARPRRTQLPEAAAPKVQQLVQPPQPSADGVAAPQTGFSAFNYAPRPNHSFSIPGHGPSATPPAAAHPAFNAQAAAALLQATMPVLPPQSADRAPPPPSSRPPPPRGPFPGPVVAAPPPPMGAAPSGTSFRRGCSDIDIAAASPPMSKPASFVLPEAIPRVGGPLDGVAGSHATSGLPSVGSSLSAQGEADLAALS